MLREQSLHTVCEEASCPNIGECFGRGTATFMVLGDLCTRRCPFCDVAHGRPLPPDPLEPQHLADTVARLGSRYVVITSVDRDDLRDGGAGHFAACIRAIRVRSPRTRIEVLTPDFRGREAIALDLLAGDPPDVMNHNLETVAAPVPPGAAGCRLCAFVATAAVVSRALPAVPDQVRVDARASARPTTKIVDVMRDLRRHGVDMLTIGQYLQPRPGNLPVHRYVAPEQFDALPAQARAMGFTHAACGPLVRSSYHADRQARAAGF